MRTSNVAGALILLLCLSALAAAGPRILYVDGSAEGDQSGLSWQNACLYLQDALAVAGATDPVEIRIARGLYTPDRSSTNPAGTGDRWASFHLRNNLTLKGGYAGIEEPDPNERDPQLHKTFLSGDLLNNDAHLPPQEITVATPTRSDNVVHVIVALYTDETAVLDGLTIASGHAYHPEHVPYGVAGAFYHCFGGALHAHTGDRGYGEVYGTPTVRNCTFTDNFAYLNGGAVAASGTYENCTFHRNATACDTYSCGGGAIYSDHQQPSPETVLRDCLFTDNHAVGLHSGAGAINGEYAMVENCTFKNNSARYGGAIRASGPILDCLFESNTADYCGGAMMDPEIIRNCTFIANKVLAWEEDPQMYFELGGGAICTTANGGHARDIHNCLFAGNSAYYGGAIRAGGYNSGTINLFNCTIVGNYAFEAGGFFGNHPSTLKNCIVFDNRAQMSWSKQVGGWTGAIELQYCLIEDMNLPHINIIDVDPCFVDPGYWADPCNTQYDISDDVFRIGDYHLKSQAGRWDAATMTWIRDDITSPAIDAGDPEMPVAPEYWPHGDRLNLGFYGATPQASLSATSSAIAGDFDADNDIDFADLTVMMASWDQGPELLEADLDRNSFVGCGDLAIIAACWLFDLKPGPAYQPFPPDGATGISTSLTVTWQGGAGAQSHDIFFGSILPPSHQFVTTATSWSLPTLAPNTTYYWYINEINSIDTTVGPMWSFTTGR